MLQSLHGSRMQRMLRMPVSLGSSFICVCAPKWSSWKKRGQGSLLGGFSHMPEGFSSFPLKGTGEVGEPSIGLSCSTGFPTLNLGVAKASVWMMQLFCGQILHCCRPFSNCGCCSIITNPFGRGFFLSLSRHLGHCQFYYRSMIPYLDIQKPDIFAQDFFLNFL